MPIPKNRLAILAATALAGLTVAPAAHAGHDWYILDQLTSACVPADGPEVSFKTPNDMFVATRLFAKGTIHVIRKNSRTVYVQASEDSLIGPVTVFWFPSKQSCAGALAAVIASGALPDRSAVN